MMYEHESAIDTIQHDWNFIGGKTLIGESTQESLSRRVKHETGIKVDNIKFLSGKFYHAKLTDENVNNIKRREEQLLDFFTLKEIHKLPLSSQAKEFIQEYGNLIQD